MEVITSHTNADFDTLGAMVAAKKLYPAARLVFSGSLEKALADALPTLGLQYDFERPGSVDLSKITRLILVDVRSPSRIGRFAEVLGRPGVEVHIYDHHPAGGDEIKAGVELIETCGSTTTVLARILDGRGIKLTPAEATVLMVGIYEDTGSLSYPSTTPVDYEAAAWLLKSGADLRRVSALVKKEMTAEDVSALNALIENETRLSIGGFEVVIAACSVDEYGGDVSALAHRLRDVEGVDALFVLADAGERIHLVARSAVEEIDAGLVAKALGGGGHRFAASATLKGMSLVEARERVASAVRDTAVSTRTAADIMSAPVITAASDEALSDVSGLMVRYNVNAVPVLTRARIAGVITRQVVSKAIFHGLGSAKVADYMTTEFASVPSDAPLSLVRDKVLLPGQRLLPVVDKGRVVGVITRTDLMKLMRDGIAAGRDSGGAPREKTRSIESLMRERLPGRVMEFLADAGQVAGELGYKAYVVGGFVRDLFLRRENLDVDVVVEGDGIRFAKALSEKKGFACKSHERFKTAVLKAPDGFEVDVATARLEYYERPGVLPMVEHSSLKLDLFRRDFTINTLAVAINPEKFGLLVDYFGALADMKSKTIRALHNLSFVEDPTRILRAVRFAERFGFRLAKQTEGLVKTTVKLDIYSKASGARLGDELRNMLAEETAGEALSRLNGLGALALIDPLIKWDRECKTLFGRAKDALAWHRLLYREDRTEDWMTLFLALTDSLGDAELATLAKRLQIAGRRRAEVLAARRSGLDALSRLTRSRAPRPSAVYDELKALPLEVALYMMAKSRDERVRKAISRYIERDRDVKTLLGGRDVEALGIKRGPAIGNVLKKLLDGRLDGEFVTREDELKEARRLAKRL